MRANLPNNLPMNPMNIAFTVAREMLLNENEQLFNAYGAFNDILTTTRGEENYNIIADVYYMMSQINKLGHLPQYYRNNLQLAQQYNPAVYVAGFVSEFPNIVEQQDSGVNFLRNRVVL